MSINRVSIAGYLTRDAELRTVNGNLAVLGFTVAINEKRKDRGSGQYVDAPVFVRCAVFGQRAEHLAQYMTKGTKVMIDGRLHYCHARIPDRESGLVGWDTIDGINAELQDQYEQWGVTSDGRHCCTGCLSVTEDDRYVTPDGTAATPLDGIRN